MARPSSHSIGCAQNRNTQKISQTWREIIGHPIPCPSAMMEHLAGLEPAWRLLTSTRVRSAAANPVHTTGTQGWSARNSCHLVPRPAPAYWSMFAGWSASASNRLGYAQTTWWLRRISRPRHSRLQCDALPSELRSPNLVDLENIEISTSALQVRRSAN